MLSIRKVVIYKYFLKHITKFKKIMCKINKNNTVWIRDKEAARRACLT